MLATTDARERMAASQSAGLKPQPGRDAWGLYRCWETERFEVLGFILYFAQSGELAFPCS